jgi:hypothetical protein
MSTTSAIPAMSVKQPYFQTIITEFSHAKSRFFDRLFGQATSASQPCNSSNLQNRKITPQASKIAFLSTVSEETLNRQWNQYLQLLMPVLLENIELSQNESLKKDLKQSLDKLSFENLKSFFNVLIEQTLEHNLPELPSTILEAVSLERLSGLIKSEYPQFVSASEWAKTIAACLPPLEKLPSSARAAEPQDKKTQIISSFFPNLGKIFMRSFDLFDSEKPPESLYEYGVLVTLYFNFFSIPYYLVQALSVVIVNPWLVLAATLAIVGTAISALYAYLHYFKKCPSNVMFCENLSKKDNANAQEAVIGRAAEYQKIRNHFSTNKKIVLIGKPGVGKTELMHGLAKEFPESQVFKFKNWSLFGGNILSPGDKMDVAFKEVRGFENQVIFCYDELGDGIKNTGFADYLKLVLPHRNIRFVAAMTKDQWDKLQEDKNEQGFKDRFTPIFLEEPNSDQIEEILSKRVRKYADDVYVTHAALKDIIESTSKKSLDCAQPRGAITALDELIGRIRQPNLTTYINPELKAAQSALKALQAQALAADSPLLNPYSKSCRDYLAEIEGVRHAIGNFEKASHSQKELSSLLTQTLAALKKYQDEQISLTRAWTGSQSPPSENEEKKLLFATFFALPMLQIRIEAIAKKLL